MMVLKRIGSGFDWSRSPPEIAEIFSRRGTGGELSVTLIEGGAYARLWLDSVVIYLAIEMTWVLPR